MTRGEIKRTQERVGTEPDGFWGPMSISACQAHLRALTPTDSPFPKQADVTSYFGPHGETGGPSPPMARFDIPFQVYYDGVARDNLACHELCAPQLYKVFQALYEVYPREIDRNKAGVSYYYGIYNPRKIRAGGSWSMHAWAIAIDLDAARNRNRSHWPLWSRMPIEVMECFAAEGFRSAGAWWSRDAMHFDAIAI